MSMRTVDTAGYATPRDSYQNQGQPETAPESISVIDRFSNFDGTFEANRDLRVEGQVKGTITCQGTLHIAQGANVNARVDAENISVAGELDGEINCKGRLQILPSGRVRGKIDTGTLVINEGAFYEGELQMGGGASLGSGRLARARGQLASQGSPVPINGESTRPSGESTPASGAAGSSTFIRRFGGQEQNWESEQRAGEAPPPESNENS